MTIRNAYEFALIECNKLKAPALLLEDYIYLFNKAIQQYVNSVYNRAEYNQQSSDDLGWLQVAKKLNNGNNSENFNGNITTFDLPDDYLHLLNCKARISNKKIIKNRCEDKELTVSNLVNCSRLTANLDGGITGNYYNKPSHRKPYYYIINRSSDQSNPSIEIHLGESKYTVDEVQLTYLRSPKYVSMTQEDLLSVEDNTQVLEFPDYVCYEIINIYVRLLLENASDPRLSTVTPINQSIAVG